MKNLPSTFHEGSSPRATNPIERGIAFLEDLKQYLITEGEPTTRVDEALAGLQNGQRYIRSVHRLSDPELANFQL